MLHVYNVGIYHVSYIRRASSQHIFSMLHEILAQDLARIINHHNCGAPLPFKRKQ